MEMTVIVALIGALATVAAAFLSAYATVRSAEVAAKKGPKTNVQIVEILKKRARGIGVWALGLAALVGLASGLLFREFSQTIAERVRRNAMGDLAHIQEIENSRISIHEMPNRQNTAPWEPAGRSLEGLSLDSCPEGGRRPCALRLLVNLEPKDKNAGDVKWAGARLDEGSLPSDKTDLVVAWVYLPRSESGDAAKMEAEISGSTEDEDGRPLAFMGRQVALKPGAWTPLLLPVSGAVQPTPSPPVSGGTTAPVASKGRLRGLTIMIWATSKSYSGSVFIGDVSFFQSKGT